MTNTKPLSEAALERRDRSRRTALSVIKILHYAGVRLVDKKKMVRRGVQVDAFTPDSARIEIAHGREETAKVLSVIYEAFSTNPRFSLTRVRYHGRVVLYATLDVPVPARAAVRR